MTADQLRECREAFEEAALTNRMYMARDGEGYANHITEAAWWGYRLACNTRPTAVASSPVEAIGVASRNEADGGNKEAVAWQYRVQGKPWRTVSKSTFDKYRDGSNYEWRELFTHPSRSGDEARDAARYRWLRELPRNYDGRKNGFHVTLAKAKDAPREWVIESMRGLDLDQAIDAAMAALGGEKAA